MKKFQYKRKFKGKTRKEVSAEMSRVASARVRHMTPEEKKRNARKMVEARGHWEGETYIWHKKK